ncbi:fibronectin type III domain-containing protein [Flavobacterium sp. AG291]|uniref:fibronectin type III domain-containing protein n=1 Tax=Flavobacterium sp. AG291 TaxID=2184000 RepID=UPI000E0AA187|nr:fibronectin type III domain-containing protein [Flavobacterium sp. AG291]RDI12098.1 putative secreted protein (Por secretion system target) [Flavobacterium sp. AG291]
MKKIILLLGLCFASQTWAQDCTPLSYYTENFETATVPSLPSCSTASGSNTWTTANNPGNGFDNNTLKYTGNTQAANAWFFSKGIAMTQSVWYKISYRYGNNGVSTEDLVVTLGTTGTSADPAFQTHAGITGGTPTTFLLTTFPAQSTATYYLGFHATSAANQGNIYVDDIVVEPVTCNNPENIQVTNLTTTGATFTWDDTANNNTDMFTVYHYGYMTSNTPPTNAGDIHYNNLTSNDVTDLQPGTTYYLFVRTQCQPVVGGWSEPVIFTTPTCAATTVPYTEDFETATTPSLPSCTSGDQWVTGANPGSGFESNALQYTAGTETANAWFFTQGIQLNVGSFYKLRYSYGNNSSETTESLATVIATSPNAASVIGTVNDLTNITGNTPTVHTSGIVTVPTSGVYYFGFNAHSEANAGNLYVDNIEVKDWDCGVPLNITATAITPTSATISWETPEENTSFGYLVAHPTTNTAPESGEYVPALTKEFTDLTPGTTYYIFVRSQCGPLMGDWSESISFTTPACEPTTVPYILDFESATVPATPECTIAQEAISGNDWVTANNPGSGFTSNTLVYTATNDAANSWFYTQGIQLTEGTLYKVSYKYGNNGTSTENLKVTLNSNPNPNYQIGNNFGTHEGITGGTQEENSIEYFNMPTGVYYFGFNAYSEAGQGAIYIDDFKIEVIDCGEPTNGSATVTTTTATITWEAATSGNATPNVYHITYGTTDTLPTEGWENESGTSKTYEGLEPGTQYYAFIRVQCGPSNSGWITIPFTTEEVAGLGDNTLKNITAYPNPVKDVLNLNAQSTIEKVEVYSITGQLVHTQNVNTQNAVINLQQLSTGAYLVNVIGENGSKRIKIIKE